MNARSHTHAHTHRILRNPTFYHKSIVDFVRVRFFVLFYFILYINFSLSQAQARTHAHTHSLKLTHHSPASFIVSLLLMVNLHFGPVNRVCVCVLWYVAGAAVVTATAAAVMVNLIDCNYVYDVQNADMLFHFCRCCISIVSYDSYGWMDEKNGWWHDATNECVEAKPFLPCSRHIFRQLWWYHRACL